MPMTPEQAQQLSDLQRRILANTAAGRPSSHGIEKDEIAKAVDILRGDRTSAMASAAAKGKTKKAAAKTSSESLEARLKARGINLDE